MGGQGPLLAWIDLEHFLNRYWIGKKKILQCIYESIFLPTSKAESEVVLLPLFVFASMLRILMMPVAVQLCGGWCCQVIFRYILRPVFSPFFTWRALRESGTLLNEVKLCKSAVHKRQNEHVHNNVHQAEYSTFSSRLPKIWTSSGTTLLVTLPARTRSIVCASCNMFGIEVVAEAGSAPVIGKFFLAQFAHNCAFIQVSTR